MYTKNAKNRLIRYNLWTLEEVLENNMVLLKGFEIEIYTGTPQGDIVGLSDKIVTNLDGIESYNGKIVIELYS